MTWYVNYIRKRVIMKKIILFEILIIALLLVECSNKKANHDNISEVNNKVASQILNFPESGEDTLKASYFADTVIYIPLETTTESFMDNIKQVWINDSVILINCRRAGLLMFQRNGKFVRKIGKNGRGPGEYELIHNFDVIHDTIYVSGVRRRSLLRYTIDGTFCDEIKFNYTPVYLSNTADQKFAYYDIYSGKVFVYNKNFYAPDTIIVEYGVTKGRYYWGPLDPNMTYLQKTPSGLLFTDYLNDTIWNITANKKEPAYILNMENKLPRDKQIEFCDGNVEGWEQMAKSYQLVHLIPFSSWMFVIQKHWMTGAYNAIYVDNTKTGEIKRFNTKYIYDDIVGKQRLWLIFYTYSEDYLVTIGSGPVKDKYSIQGAPSSFWLDQMKNVKEDDNPILALIKLKRTCNE